ncbi:uncharacterized protein LOC108051146 isoform X2 [Drosophila rhopaloa]|uniref:Uncharacterized protein LOC108051146 isoform X2 n=1 Tax=Drosophila rhopaloa TaxID=1041015 RepID=A0A6P4FMD2_DRORH|nr:uncharacterized protein LOC108051146 isoform X2 [Drosophila rhopaloa]
MRSLFSNRYNNKRQAREDQPSLPIYERAAGRRYKSYRQMANISREQLLSDSWLSTDRLPIVMRRSIERRTNRLLMPRYNPALATHEFSHNGRPRRGRPPAAATLARSASDFAVQVGGLPRPVGGGEEAQESDSDPQSPVQEIIDADEYPDTESETETGLHLNTDLGQPEVGQNNLVTPSQNLAMNSGHNVAMNSNDSLNPNSIQNTPQDQNPNQQQNQHYSPVIFTDDEDENIPPNLSVRTFLGAHRPPNRCFICPEQNCQQIFDVRRDLYKHQRDAGHHNWSHKCEKCGQIFRTAGFKRMHADKACERNLQKKKLKTK